MASGDREQMDNGIGKMLEECIRFESEVPVAERQLPLIDSSYVNACTYRAQTLLRLSAAEFHLDYAGDHLAWTASLKDIGMPTAQPCVYFGLAETDNSAAAAHCELNSKALERVGAEVGDLSNQFGSLKDKGENS